jgi:hypothetical protein
MFCDIYHYALLHYVCTVAARRLLERLRTEQMSVLKPAVFYSKNLVYYVTKINRFYGALIVLFDSISILSFFVVSASIFSNLKALVI